MANYTFLDASGATKTAASSTISGVEYPIVKISDPVSVVGTLSQSGTVITSVAGLVNVNSIIGTYIEDAQHSSDDTGMFVMGVRNDNLASITSLDSDYTRFTVGPMGETITANAPITKWVQGVASAFTGVIQPIIAAQGASIFTYVTGVQIANQSANVVLTTLYGAESSVVGYSVIPANTTIPIVFPNALKTNANGAFSASISGVASVYLSAQGFISKT